MTKIFGVYELLIVDSSLNLYSLVMANDDSVSLNKIKWLGDSKVIKV